MLKRMRADSDTAKSPSFDSYIVCRVSCGMCPGDSVVFSFDEANWYRHGLYT